MSSLTDYRAKTEHLVIALMSGTSADGVDAVLVRISGQSLDLRVELLQHEHLDYPEETRAAVLRACLPDCPVTEITRLSVELGEQYAQAVIAVARSHGTPLQEIDLVASHGQTVCHLPNPGGGGATLQIGEPAVIAERTGVTVVADFRPADMAAGGQGAPLVPYADWVLFCDSTLTRAIQNIGGIGNVTYVPAGAAIDDVIAFDTGPGNMVIDGVVALLSGGSESYDRDGIHAARGQVNDELLAWLIQHPYLQRQPPKSTGREEFGEQFVVQAMAHARGLGVEDDDLVATVTAFTAETIADSYRRFLPQPPIDEVVLGGGGSLNPTLCRMIAQRLPGAKLLTHEDFGIPAQAKEPLAFAILGHETVMGRPANVPRATGARHPVILGKIIPPSPKA